MNQTIEFQGNFGRNVDCSYIPVSLLRPNERILSGADFDSGFRIGYERFRSRSRYILGSDLAVGLQDGEEHPAALVSYFQWRAEALSEGGSASLSLIAPEDPMLLFTASYQLITEALRAGKIRPHQVIIPALSYVSPDNTYYHQSPFIDPAPPLGFKLVDGAQVLSYQEWARAVGIGRRPVSASELLIYHEISHQTEDISDFSYMAAMRDVYRLHSSLFETLRIRNGSLSSAEIGAFERAQMRMSIFAESVAIHRPAASSLLGMFIPADLQNGTLQFLSSVVERLSQLTEVDFNGECSNLLEYGNRCLLRSGGALRDTFHLRDYLFTNNALEEQIIRASKAKGFIQPCHKEFLGPLQYGVFSSLTTILHEIRLIHTELNARNMQGGVACSLLSVSDRALKSMLIDRVARFQMGVWKSKELGVTRAGIIRGMGSVVANEETERIKKWLESFHPADSVALRLLN